MRLGCSYNVFDGEEILPYSVQTVRAHAAHIVVVYQTVSNFGLPAKGEMLRKLLEMHEIGLVDELVEYTPATNGGHTNELAKRNIGLDRCRAAGCSHHVSMDCDELYDQQQLKFAMREIEDGNYDSSVCFMKTYYRLPTMILDPPENYGVPLIYRIDNRKFDMNVRWSITVDPTRRLESGKLRVFDREEIEMHHFSYLRTDIRPKLNSSSAKVNFQNRIEEIAKWYDDWVPGKQAMLAGRERRMYNLKEVENIFNIKI